MSPGTHIMKHHGPTNKKLRLHIPLIGVEGARMRVENETRELVEG
jgi:aspartate beta-hydroxylase